MRQIIESRNAEHGLWGFKDPRACLFLMLWKYLLPDAKVLIVYRHFAASTYSLGRRHSGDMFEGRGNDLVHRRFFEEPDLALRMWLVHNKALLAFARAYLEDTLVVSVDMIRDGFPLVWALNRRWKLGLAEVPTAEVFDPSLTTRQPGTQRLSDSGLIPEVMATWRELEGLNRRTERMLGKGVRVAER
jgi:hypothetical protein